MKNRHYGAIDGLRMIAAFGIVLMHVRANSNYQISGFLYNSIIPSFTDFVFLFMTVSAFGMCCGYYDKMLNNQINLSYFYGKRFKKILPFFGVLVLLDILISPSLGSLYEGFADLTLMFGFLPEPLSVIGVGWFLGLVFIFYLVFPFFCVLLENKKRAWLVLLVSLIYNALCAAYFDVGRANILYSACFFITGGLIYLYQEKLSKLNRWFLLSLAGCSVGFYYSTGTNTLVCLLVAGTWLMYAISAGGGENPITHFFSGISMEIYLSHMMIFRVIEKLNLNQLIGDGWLQYIITSILVLIGTTVFAVVMQKIINQIATWIGRRRKAVIRNIKYENINDK